MRKTSDWLHESLTCVFGDYSICFYTPPSDCQQSMELLQRVSTHCSLMCRKLIIEFYALLFTRQIHKRPLHERPKSIHKFTIFPSMDYNFSTNRDGPGNFCSTWQHQKHVCIPTHQQHLHNSRWAYINANVYGTNKRKNGGISTFHVYCWSIVEWRTRMHADERRERRIIPKGALYHDSQQYNAPLSEARRSYDRCMWAPS